MINAELYCRSYEGEISTVDDLAQSGVLWGELAIDWVLPLEVDERVIILFTKMIPAHISTSAHHSLTAFIYHSVFC